MVTFDTAANTIMWTFSNKSSSNKYSTPCNHDCLQLACCGHGRIFRKAHTIVTYNEVSL